MTSLAEAQTLQTLWSDLDPHHHLPSGVSNLAEGYALTVDNAGAAYAVYKLGGTGEVGVIKFAPDGQVLWDALRSVTNYAPNAIAVDAAGQVFVAGYEYTATSSPFGLGMWLMKFAPDGTFLWEQYRTHDMGPVQRYYTGNTTKPTVMMKLDAAGNPHVVGRDYHVGYPTPKVRFFVEKYDNNGQSQWTAISPQVGGAAMAMALSPAGEVYVTGGPSSSWVYTAAFGPNGAVLWDDLQANAIEPADIALNASGEALVLAQTFNGLTSNMTVFRYQGNGSLASTTAFLAGFSAYPRNLALDSQGNYLLAGQAIQASGMPYLDWLVLKGTPTGTILWSDRYDANPNNDEMVSHWDEGLSVDANDDVYVTGYGGPTFNPGLFAVNSGLVLKYDGATGARLATQVDQNQLGTAMMAIPFGGDCYVSGFGRRKVVKYGASLATGIQADLFAFLKGPYGQPTFARFMEQGLYAAGLLPLAQPYSGAPWNYPGTETVPALPRSAVDWVLVEARTGTAANTAYARQAAILHLDGLILDIHGNSLIFPNPPGGAPVYFVVYHRNHLAMMSSVAVSANIGGKYRFDFRNTFSGLGGAASGVAVNSGVWALVAGDADGDGDVTAADKNLVWFPANGSIQVYSPADLNLDGEVNALDKNLFWAPYNGRTSQVPQ